MAQENGAAALILYSDPIDDGYFRGPAYPTGPFRPSTACSAVPSSSPSNIPETPPLPASLPHSIFPTQRIAPEEAASLPKIPVTPLSSAEISPLLEKLAGPQAPRDWQGALPFAYHLGSGPVRVHLKLLQYYTYTAIWNVIGTIRGSLQPEQLGDCRQSPRCLGLRSG